MYVGFYSVIVTFDQRMINLTINKNINFYFFLDVNWDFVVSLMSVV